MSKIANLLRGAVLSTQIKPKHLPERRVILNEDKFNRALAMLEKKKKKKNMNQGIENLHEVIAIYEELHISNMLNKYDWNKLKTAKALDIGLSTLYRKIIELGIEKGD